MSDLYVKFYIVNNSKPDFIQWLEKYQTWHQYLNKLNKNNNRDKHLML